MKIPILLVFFAVNVQIVFAQDPHYTQYYANPLYLNPALAGTGDCSRIMLNYRNQWPGLTKSFTTYSLGADHYSQALSGGLGLMVFADDASGIVNTLQASAVYAYHLKLSGNMQLNAGFEVSYLQRRLDWDELVFSDMIDRTTGAVIPSNSGEPTPENLTQTTADFSAGLLLGIREKYFIGVASHHLTQPDLSYYSNNDNGLLYRKYTVHVGAEFVVKQGEYRSERGFVYLQPGIMYQQQQDAQQLTAGLNLEFFPLTAGVWYRHNIGNPDGIAALLGIKFNRLKIGYSYDFTLSKLSDGSGGAHELSLAIQFACNGKRNRPGAIKCPEF